MSRLRAAALTLFVTLVLAGPTRAERCTPTPWDEIGPFYRPNAPVRAKIGSGYLLSGRVLDTSCRPIPGARIEVWQAGLSGHYDDAHRATLFADRQGRYRLETSFPPPYARRPSHINILVDARGYQGLITQHYPKAGATKATFDLVLVLE
jgi:protocatechuate 3,4-dioxygenase beta subunit